MAITRLNSLAIPAGTVEPADISYPLTNFSSTGIDDNATSNAITIDSSQNVGIGTTPTQPLHVSASMASASAGPVVQVNETSGNARNGIHLTYTGATNTAVDTFKITDSNGTLFNVEGGGNVGIGTASPDGKLNVFSASAGTVTADADADELVLENSGNVGLSLLTAGTGESGIYFGNPGTNGQKDFYLKFYHESHATTANRRAFTFNTASTERMRIDSSGNVGIGTASPGEKLDVDGTIQVISSGNQGLAAQIYTDSAGNMNLLADHGNNGGGDHIFRNGSTGTELVRILNTGNVGIGTSSPGYKLQLNSVGDNDGLLIKSGSSAYINYLLFGDSGSNTVGRLGYNHANNSMTFFTVDSERMRISSAGFVGIGTSSPDRYLHVNQSRSGDWLAEIHNTHTTNGYGLKVRAGDDANVTAMRVVDVNNTTIMEIQGGGNVGIGTSSPSGKLHLVGNPAYLFVSDSRGSQGTHYIGTNGTSGQNMFISANTGGISGGDMVFLNGGTERMRLEDSGNLLVGHTSNNTYNTTAGSEIWGSGFASHTKDGGICLILNRLTSDGDILVLRKDGTTVGSISSIQGTGIRINSQGSDGYLQKAGSDKFVWTATAFSPADDNFRDLGQTNLRYDDIYATNATIQTSDANEKQDIEALSEAEARVAVAAKALLRKFRWKSAVEEKGDEARVHFGIIAQDLKAAFEAEGLDAGRYAMFIHSTWTDEETGEERSRMGVRYSELLAFIIAAI